MPQRGLTVPVTEKLPMQGKAPCIHAGLPLHMTLGLSPPSSL